MILLQNLSRKETPHKYTYSDLNLDFEKQKVSTNSRNSDIVTGTDIVVDHDSEAIKNAIYNLLFQRRHLTFIDVNLRKYIGEVVSEANGEALGEDIKRVVDEYEPRVRCEKVLVHANSDEFLYRVAMFVRVLKTNEVIQIDTDMGRHTNFRSVNN